MYVRRTYVLTRIAYGRASEIGVEHKAKQYADAYALRGEARVPVTAYPIVIESNGAITKESANSLRFLATLGCSSMQHAASKVQELRTLLAYTVATNNGLMLTKTTINST